jgi:hypothetical protein
MNFVRAARLPGSRDDVDRAGVQYAMMKGHVSPWKKHQTPHNSWFSVEGGSDMSFSTPVWAIPRHLGKPGNTGRGPDGRLAERHQQAVATETHTQRYIHFTSVRFARNTMDEVEFQESNSIVFEWTLRGLKNLFESRCVCVLCMSSA